MISYVDASALVKRYVAERGSDSVNELVAEATGMATALVTRAEVGAALAKAVRLSALSREAGQRQLRIFAGEWISFAHVPITQELVSRAEALAWEHGLRGYDAVHLAAALTWQQSVGQPIVLATFDRQLWEAGAREGLRVWPEELPAQ